jgi:HPt (histidine-containing phosphotransfer) domain-containing protein
MDELLAKFLSQFLVVARSRIAMSHAAATQREAAPIQKIIRELHTLAGEAGLLGVSNIVPLARECEKQAKSFLANRSDEQAEVLVASLRELERVVDEIEAANPPAGGTS